MKLILIFNYIIYLPTQFVFLCFSIFSPSLKFNSYFFLFRARWVDFLLFSFLATLGVFSLTLPACAIDPCCFAIMYCVNYVNLVFNLTFENNWSGLCVYTIEVWFISSWVGRKGSTSVPEPPLHTESQNIKNELKSFYNI